MHETWRETIAWNNWRHLFLQGELIVSELDDTSEKFAICQMSGLRWAETHVTYLSICCEEKFNQALRFQL